MKQLIKKWWWLYLLCIFIAISYPFIAWMIAGDIAYTVKGKVYSRAATAALIGMPWMIGVYTIVAFTIKCSEVLGISIGKIIRHKRQ